MTLPVRRVEWKPCQRIIHIRRSRAEAFEQVADRMDIGLISMLASQTSAGAQIDIIEAPFKTPNSGGSRFSDGGHGVFYAAKDIETAIAETRYHRERFMCATAEPSMEIEMRVYEVDLEDDFHDLRGRKTSDPQVYHSDNYTQAQQLAGTLRNGGSKGIVYDSVRRDRGECVAVFHPSSLSNARQGDLLFYVWNGERITHHCKKRSHQGM